jgi:hypothetical protein
MFAVEKFSGQRLGEEMSVFFARRKAANDSRALSENLEQRSARLQREKNAAKGQVPGKSSKAARVFVWEKVDGHYIRQAAGRTNYEDQWEAFAPSQRVYDSFRNEWDLCETFGSAEDCGFVNGEESDDGDDDDFKIPLLPETDHLARSAHTSSKVDLDRIYPAAETSVDEPYQFETLSAECQAHLRFGYVSSGPTTSAPPTLKLPTPVVVAKTLGNKDVVLPQNDQLLRLQVFLAQMRDASHPDMISRDLFDFHSETGSLHQVWNMDISSFESGGKTYYRVQEYNVPGQFCIILSRATTALEIARSRWGPDLASVARQLLSRGMSFRLCITDSAGTSRLPNLYLPRYSGLGYRSQGHKPDRWDYALYVSNRDRFLMTTRGHAALRYGGVVGRIAQAVLLSEDALLGPSDDVTEHGICFQNRRSNELYWDDELSAEELDLICGIYHVATGSCLSFVVNTLH